MQLTVHARREAATGIMEFTLRRSDGGRVPDWAPGAHIDVTYSGRTRQYSLCGDRRDPYMYRIAVQREPDGRGGSVALHDELEVGSPIDVGGPRNNFRLAPASSYLFVAGGIGITPILPMIRQAHELDADWRLLYLGRSEDRFLARTELALHSARVRLHSSDLEGRAPLDGWRPENPETRVYACGPSRLLDAVEA